MNRPQAGPCSSADCRFERREYDAPLTQWASAAEATSVPLSAGSAEASGAKTTHEPATHVAPLRQSVLRKHVEALVQAGANNAASNAIKRSLTNLQSHTDTSCEHPPKYHVSLGNVTA